MLNWIVLNKTDYLHKNGFGVKYQQRLICYKTQQTKPIKYCYITLIILFNINLYTVK